MTKTWETLFNLSSFMKYMLTEVLPDEKVESPAYVLDSLYEMLAVTVSCIEKIKSPQSNFISKNQFLGQKVEELISSRTKKPSGRNVLNNIPKIDTEFVNNLSESNISHNPKPHSQEEFISDNRVVSAERQYTISEEFLKLNNEMHNGRPFGHYCKPCDKVIFSKMLWDKHNSDKLHICYLKEKCGNNYSSCSYCNLIIFATFSEAEYLFINHQKQHLKPHNKTFKIDCQNKENLKQVENEEETGEDIRFPRSIDSEVAFHGSETRPSISLVFVDLDKQMHAGNESGFYCHSCDEAFDEVAKWNKHFQEVKVHIDSTSNSECFEMCESCLLVTFAAPAVQKVYKAYHLIGHVILKEKDKTSRPRSIGENSLEGNCQKNQETSNSHGNNGNDNRKSSNTYVIAEQFKVFNSKVHSFNLFDYFYCRPCNASLSSDEWCKHYSCRKHLQLMSNRKFQNWKGKCTYCSLTIIGTRDTVRYYMDYHNIGHKRVLSYDEERIRQGIKKNYTRRNFRSENSQSPANSMSTLGDDEDYEDGSGSDNEDKINESGNRSTCINENYIVNKLPHHNFYEI